MARNSVTLFSWGYYGWGTSTNELIQTVDAVEKSRGWSSPVFVDIRASRKVRAEGFRESAFEKRHGPERYRWLQGLGNKAILTGDEFGEFVDVRQVADLLDLALELHEHRRRVILFCSCPIPFDGCHRRYVAPELFKVARRRNQPVTVVEWPGFESDPDDVLTVSVSKKVAKEIVAGTRNAVPLGTAMPSSALLGIPWYTPVNLVSAEAGRPIPAALVGPAEHRAIGWQLPWLGHAVPAREGLKTQQHERKAMGLLPRAWPKDAPAQEPKKLWRP